MLERRQLDPDAPSPAPSGCRSTRIFDRSTLPTSFCERIVTDSFGDAAASDASICPANASALLPFMEWHCVPGMAALVP